jgi:hypothetical protein
VDQVRVLIGSGLDSTQRGADLREYADVLALDTACVAPILPGSGRREGAP